VDLLDTLPADSNPTEIMCWRRTFAGRPDQAARVRHFVSFLLADFSMVGGVVEVTGELVCNAVQHTLSKLPGGLVTVEVRRWPGGCVTLSVSDQGGKNEPHARPLDDSTLLDEGGRGLGIVSATATHWGWTGDVRGRTVTALFLG
jgi:serine/threonine-protein kinase RsbW